MKRILIVKMSSIGDVLQALPILSYLKKRMPDVIIDWVVEALCSDFMKALPEVNDVIVIDTKKWRKSLHQPSTWKEIYKAIRSLRGKSYDCLFDLQGNCKSGLIDFFAKALVKVGFGKNSVAEKINLLFTTHRYEVYHQDGIYQRYMNLIAHFFSDTNPVSFDPIELVLNDYERVQLLQLLSLSIFKSSTLFMLSFGSNWENKKLSDATLKELIQWSIETLGVRFLITYCGQTEKMQAQKIQDSFPSHVQIIGGLSIPLWQHLMRYTNGVVCMDSAALALAAISKVPTLTFFGPTSSLVYKPKGKMHMAVEGFCPYGSSFAYRCKYLRTCRTGSCLKDLSLSALQIPFMRFIDSHRENDRSQDRASLAYPLSPK